MENVVSFTNYEGECPAESDKSNISVGTHFYNWTNAIEGLSVADPPTDDKGKRLTIDVKAGLSISGKRLKALPEDHQPRFQRKLMTVISFLGEGSYGKVWRAKFTKTAEVAVKQLPSYRYTDELWKERDLLIKLKHIRVINLIGAFHDGDFYLVMDLCYGSLNNKILDLTDENKTRFILQLAEAMYWIHSNDIIHCDIKPDNVLITSSNNAVLSDFGAAILLKNGTDAVLSPQRRGFPGYQDLEANEQKLYSKANDMFAFGCVVFEIDTGSACLLKYRTRLDRAIESAEYCRCFRDGRVRHLKPDQVPGDEFREPLETRALKIGLLGCVLKGLVAVREQRMTAKQVLEHPAILKLRQKMENQKWKLDNGDDMVANGMVLENYNKGFSCREYATKQERAALAGIYYDQDEDPTPTGSKAGRCLDSYDGHVISKFVDETGLGGILSGAMASKDRYAIGALRSKIVDSLTHHFMGRKGILEQLPSENENLPLPAPESVNIPHLDQDKRAKSKQSDDKNVQNNSIDDPTIEIESNAAHDGKEKSTPENQSKPEIADKSVSGQFLAGGNSAGDKNLNEEKEPATFNYPNEKLETGQTGKNSNKAAKSFALATSNLMHSPAAKEKKTMKTITDDDGIEKDQHSNIVANKRGTSLTSGVFKHPNFMNSTSSKNDLTPPRQSPTGAHPKVYTARVGKDDKLEASQQSSLFSQAFTSPLHSTKFIAPPAKSVRSKPTIPVETKPTKPKGPQKGSTCATLPRSTVRTTAKNGVTEIQQTSKNQTVQDKKATQRTRPIIETPKRGKSKTIADKLKIKDVGQGRNKRSRHSPVEPQAKMSSKKPNQSKLAECPVTDEPQKKKPRRNRNPKSKELIDDKDSENDEKLKHITATGALKVGTMDQSVVEVDEGSENDEESEEIEINVYICKYCGTEFEELEEFNRHIFVCPLRKPRKLM